MMKKLHFDDSHICVPNYFIIMSNNNKSLSSEDYESMGESEKKLVEELSGFSFQNSFLQLLKKQYGDTTSK